MNITVYLTGHTDYKEPHVYHDAKSEVVTEGVYFIRTKDDTGIMYPLTSIAWVDVEEAYA